MEWPLTLPCGRVVAVWSSLAGSGRHQMGIPGLKAQTSKGKTSWEAFPGLHFHSSLTTFCTDRNPSRYIWNSQSCTAKNIQLRKNISIFLLPQVTPKNNLDRKYPFIFSWLADFIVAFNYLFPVDWILPWREVGLSTDFPNSRNME